MEHFGQLDAALERVGAFFMGDSPVQKAARKIAKHLEEAGIDYAIAGRCAWGRTGSFGRRRTSMTFSSRAKDSIVSNRSGSVEAT